MLVCADDICRGKPDPEGHLVAAERLGRAPETCVVIGDAPAGVEAARAAGMRCIGISGTYSSGALEAADVVVPSIASLSVTREQGGLAISVAGA
ncbi:MAG: HAD-superfamily hydrolase, subfamily variant 3 [Geminicoccaceae bacterium]|nr:HAD-superfamily hydrolase, subfamily variant 3 [Geminicoccaceae bacterium]